MRKGFTLAETLIVLAIIGVVAVLTLPVLNRNWQENRWKTADEAFRNRVTEATSQMNARGKLVNGYPSTLDFVNELKNFMKITEVCTTTSACFADIIAEGEEEIQTSMVI